LSVKTKKGDQKMTKREAREFLRGFKELQGGDILNIELNDDQMCFEYVDDDENCYFGVYTPADGLDLEPAGTLDDWI
jgi:hypothetical protein